MTLELNREQQQRQQDGKKTVQKYLVKMWPALRKFAEMLNKKTLAKFMILFILCCVFLRVKALHQSFFSSSINKVASNKSAEINIIIKKACKTRAGRTMESFFIIILCCVIEKY